MGQILAVFHVKFLLSFCYYYHFVVIIIIVVVVIIIIKAE